MRSRGRKHEHRGNRPGVEGPGLPRRRPGGDHPAGYDAGHPAGEIVLEAIGGSVVPMALDTQWQCTRSEYPCTVHPICPMRDW
jgi:hypothetical protein